MTASKLTIAAPAIITIALLLPSPAVVAPLSPLAVPLNGIQVLDDCPVGNRSDCAAIAPVLACREALGDFVGNHQSCVYILGHRHSKVSLPIYYADSLHNESS